MRSNAVYTKSTSGGQTTNVLIPIFVSSKMSNGYIYSLRMYVHYLLIIFTQLKCIDGAPRVRAFYTVLIRIYDCFALKFEVAKRAWLRAILMSGSSMNVKRARARSACEYICTMFRTLAVHTKPYPITVYCSLDGDGSPTGHGYSSVEWTCAQSSCGGLWLHAIHVFVWLAQIWVALLTVFSVRKCITTKLHFCSFVSN